MTLRHINIRWRQIWCFRKGNRKEKVVTLCITPFNVEQTTCIVCYAFSAFSLIATHLNDPVSVCYPDWMDEGKLGKREQKIIKKKGCQTLECTSLRGKKTSANQAVLQWLKKVPCLCMERPLSAHSHCSLSWRQHWSFACGGPPDSVRSAKRPFHHWPDRC